MWAMAHGPRLCCRLVQDTTETVLLAAAGEIDLATAEEVDAALDPFIDADRPVLLDMRAVTFIDCCGLRSLQRARARNPQFTLIAPSQPVLRLLELIGPNAPLPWIAQVPQVEGKGE
ncbi:MAG TPA: STAS domain-containing protein [Actinocrinis sp.]|nr:STAS domain-containing protein [Actinocrinis sp.]